MPCFSLAVVRQTLIKCPRYDNDFKTVSNLVLLNTQTRLEEKVLNTFESLHTGENEKKSFKDPPSLGHNSVNQIFTRQQGVGTEIKSNIWHGSFHSSVFPTSETRFQKLNYLFTSAARYLLK